MSEGAQFRIGAEVRCSTGEVCGEVRYLYVSRDAHRLTHLAVEEKGRQGLGRLVPIDKVQIDSQTREIQFQGTMADFTKLEASDVTTFAPVTAAYKLYGPEQVIEEPEYDPSIPGEQVAGNTVPGRSATETSDIIPPGDEKIGRHYPVHAGSHKFGRVHGVVTDSDHDVTHVLLGEWHELHRKEVAVPFGDQDMIDDDGFHFSMSKQEVENLPPSGSNRPGA
jgi:hypothetical protein